jgi:hypothetical protein
VSDDRDPGWPALLEDSRSDRDSAPGTSFGFERRAAIAQSKAPAVISLLSLVLAVIAPPLGVVTAIVAIVVGIRMRGFAATTAKIALAIGVVLSLVLAVALCALDEVGSRQAAHDRIVASSIEYCAELEKKPGLLSSSTFAFPGAQDTAADSIAAVQDYSDYWKGLVKVAPAGIRGGTRTVATTVGEILESSRESQVFDDASNASRMQPVVAASGITSWVSQYCN